MACNKNGPKETANTYSRPRAKFAAIRTTRDQYNAQHASPHTHAHCRHSCPPTMDKSTPLMLDAKNTRSSQAREHEIERVAVTFSNSATNDTAIARKR